MFSVEYNRNIVAGESATSASRVCTDSVMEVGTGGRERGGGKSRRIVVDAQGSWVRVRTEMPSKGSENMRLALGEMNTSQPSYKARARESHRSDKKTRTRRSYFCAVVTFRSRVYVL